MKCCISEAPVLFITLSIQMELSRKDKVRMVLRHMYLHLDQLYLLTKRVSTGLYMKKENIHLTDLSFNKILTYHKQPISV